MYAIEETNNHNNKRHLAEPQETLYFLEDDEFVSMMESIEYLRVLERVPK